MQIDSKMRTQMFFAFIGIAIFLLAITGSQAGRQNQTLIEDSQRYQQAEQLIKASKFADAAPLYASLLKSHDYYYIFHWRYGLCLAGQQKWSDAIVYFDKARQIRPALVSDQVFLIQYGELLFRTGQYGRSERYLQQCLTYGADTEPGKIATRLLPVVQQQLTLQKGGQIRGE